MGSTRKPPRELSGRHPASSGVAFPVCGRKRPAKSYGRAPRGRRWPPPPVRSRYKDLAARACWGGSRSWPMGCWFARATAHLLPVPKLPCPARKRHKPANPAAQSCCCYRFRRPDRCRPPPGSARPQTKPASKHPTSRKRLRHLRPCGETTFAMNVCLASRCSPPADLGNQCIEQITGREDLVSQMVLVANSQAPEESIGRLRPPNLLQPGVVRRNPLRGQAADVPGGLPVLGFRVVLEAPFRFLGVECCHLLQTVHFLRGEFDAEVTLQIAPDDIRQLPVPDQLSAGDDGVPCGSFRDDSENPRGIFAVIHAGYQGSIEVQKVRPQDSSRHQQRRGAKIGDHHFHRVAVD